MGAHAFTRGARIAFARDPDLHTAAHEAAHVVQQQAGWHPPGMVGRVGDAQERHADAVADAVVSSRSAEALLDRGVGAGGRSPASARRGAAAARFPVQRVADERDSWWKRLRRKTGRHLTSMRRWFQGRGAASDHDPSSDYHDLSGSHAELIDQSRRPGWFERTFRRRKARSYEGVLDSMAGYGHERKGLGGLEHSLATIERWKANNPGDSRRGRAIADAEGRVRALHAKRTHARGLWAGARGTMIGEARRVRGARARTAEARGIGSKYDFDRARAGLQVSQVLDRRSQRARHERRMAPVFEELRGAVEARGHRRDRTAHREQHLYVRRELLRRHELGELRAAGAERSAATTAERGGWDDRAPGLTEDDRGMHRLLGHPRMQGFHAGARDHDLRAEALGAAVSTGRRVASIAGDVRDALEGGGGDGEHDSGSPVRSGVAVVDRAAAALSGLDPKAGKEALKSGRAALASGRMSAEAGGMAEEHRGPRLGWWPGAAKRKRVRELQTAKNRLGDKGRGARGRWWRLRHYLSRGDRVEDSVRHVAERHAEASPAEHPELAALLARRAEAPVLGHVAKVVADRHARDRNRHVADAAGSGIEAVEGLVSRATGGASEAVTGGIRAGIEAGTLAVGGGEYALRRIRNRRAARVVEEGPEVHALSDRSAAAARLLSHDTHAARHTLGALSVPADTEPHSRAIHGLLSSADPAEREEGRRRIDEHSRASYSLAEQVWDARGVPSTATRLDRAEGHRRHLKERAGGDIDRLRELDEAAGDDTLRAAMGLD